MTKSKSTFPAQSKKRNSDNNISQSNVLLKLSKNDLNCHNTLPKLFNISNFESIVEKYNEKINLWQNYYLYVKQNYLYLYDKKPKTSEKPKEYLYLNNKITATFHRRLFSSIISLTSNRYLSIFFVAFFIPSTSSFIELK